MFEFKIREYVHRIEGGKTKNEQPKRNVIILIKNKITFANPALCRFSNNLLNVQIFQNQNIQNKKQRRVRMKLSKLFLIIIKTRQWGSSMDHSPRLQVELLPSISLTIRPSHAKMKNKMHIKSKFV